MQKRILIPLALLATLGAGCAGNTPPKIESVRIGANNAEHASLCINFKHNDGFKLWLDSYEMGEGNAVMLAVNISLPEKADPKLVADIRKTLESGNEKLNYLCALDAEGKIITWMTDDVRPDKTECKAIQYMSVFGVGTIADLKAEGRAEACEELCKPKIYSPETLVWQCDARITSDGATWTELRQERANGRTLPYGCKQDAKGVAEGCTP